MNKRVSQQEFRIIWNLIHWYNMNSPTKKMLPTKIDKSFVITDRNRADFRDIKRQISQYGGKAGFIQAQRQQADRSTPGMSGVRQETGAEVQGYTRQVITRLNARGINILNMPPEVNKILQEWAAKTAADIARLAQQYTDPRQKEQFVFNTIEKTIMQGFPQQSVDRYNAMDTSRK